MDTDLELRELPNAPDVVFKYAPLALALCQIRFNSILSITNPGFVGPFQRAIQDQYPLPSSAPIQELGMQIGLVTGEANIQQGSPYLRWQFTDNEDNWRIVLTPDFLAIETRTYNHFNDFLNRLRKALDALIQHIQPANGIRLGLRYVNEIRPGHVDWTKVVRSELLGPVVNPAITDQTTQVTSIQQIQLRYANYQGININHGYLPGGTTVRPRSGEEFVDQPFYLLDFDVFREFPSPNALSIDSDVICRHIKAYHQSISRLFRWSLTDQYISTLEVRHDAID